MDFIIHQLCNAFVEHYVYQDRCLVPLLSDVLIYGQEHEGFTPRERETVRERESAKSNYPRKSSQYESEIYSVHVHIYTTCIHTCIQT